MCFNLTTTKIAHRDIPVYKVMIFANNKLRCPWIPCVTEYHILHHKPKFIRPEIKDIIFGSPSPNWTPGYSCFPKKKLAQHYKEYLIKHWNVTLDSDTVLQIK